ncbi:MAG: hypothetical protein WA792_16870, partial [Pseudolabrys sp.]
GSLDTGRDECSAGNERRATEGIKKQNRKNRAASPSKKGDRTQFERARQPQRRHKDEAPRKRQARHRNAPAAGQAGSE